MYFWLRKSSEIKFNGDQGQTTLYTWYILFVSVNVTLDLAPHFIICGSLYGKLSVSCLHALTGYMEVAASQKH